MVGPVAISFIKQILSEFSFICSLVGMRLYSVTCTVRCVVSQLVVMATLSLAAKAKDMPVKLSDVVNTCYRSRTTISIYLDKMKHSFVGQMLDSNARRAYTQLRKFKIRVMDVRNGSLQYVQQSHRCLLHGGKTVR